MPRLLGGDEWQPYNSPPLMGGDKGEGDALWLFTPTSILPHRGGGGCQGKYQKPRPVVGELHYMHGWEKERRQANYWGEKRRNRL